MHLIQIRIWRRILIFIVIVIVDVNIADGFIWNFKFHEPSLLLLLILFSSMSNSAFLRSKDICSGFISWVCHESILPFAGNFERRIFTTEGRKTAQECRQEDSIARRYLSSLSVWMTSCSSSNLSVSWECSISPTFKREPDVWGRRRCASTNVVIPLLSNAERASLFDLGWPSS